MDAMVAGRSTVLTTKMTMTSMMRMTMDSRRGGGGGRLIVGSMIKAGQKGMVRSHRCRLMA